MVCGCYSHQSHGAGTLGISGPPSSTPPLTSPPSKHRSLRTWAPGRLQKALLAFDSGWAPGAAQQPQYTCLALCSIPHWSCWPHSWRIVGTLHPAGTILTRLPWLLLLSGTTSVTTERCCSQPAVPTAGRGALSVPAHSFSAESPPGPGLVSLGLLSPPLDLSSSDLHLGSGSPGPAPPHSCIFCPREQPVGPTLPALDPAPGSRGPGFPVQTAEPISHRGLPPGPSTLKVRGSLDRGLGVCRHADARWGPASTLAWHPEEEFCVPKLQSTCRGRAQRAALTELLVGLASSFSSSFRHP